MVNPYTSIELVLEKDQQDGTASHACIVKIKCHLETQVFSNGTLGQMKNHISPGNIDWYIVFSWPMLSSV